MKKLATTIEVIEHLGGNEAVARLLKTNSKAVANWRYFCIFPASTYLVLKKALEKRGYTAPDTLWNMKRGSCG